MRGDIRNSFLLYISKVQYKIGYNFMSNGIFLDAITIQRLISKINEYETNDKRI